MVIEMELKYGGCWLDFPGRISDSWDCILGCLDCMLQVLVSILHFPDFPLSGRDLRWLGSHLTYVPVGRSWTIII